MGELFNRNYELIVGPKNQLGIRTTGLRVQFKMDKSLEKYPNNATIEVTNLDKESRSAIQNLSGNSVNNPAVILSVGYQKQLTVLYQGDIAKMVTRRQGPDLLTSFECGDGQAAFNSAKTDVSFNPGTTFQNVINRLASDFGVGLGQVRGINNNDQFINGLTLSGNTRDHLTTLLNRQGLDWSVQNNQLQILPKDGSTAQEVVFLDKKSGLIGDPFIEKVFKPELSKDKKEVESSGVKLLSLLNPNLTPGRQIKVSSEFVNGLFTIKKVTHIGDTHGQQWYSEIETV